MSCRWPKPCRLPGFTRWKLNPVSSASYASVAKRASWLSPCPKAAAASSTSAMFLCVYLPFTRMLLSSLSVFPPAPHSIRLVSPDRHTVAVQTYDALVVGAGPAGSSTAIHLARAGARVLLAEKARFPRDKPCGGGLTGRALKRMPVDPSPVVERDVDRFDLRLGYGSSFSRSHDAPLIRMTQRRRLDAFLAEHAAAAGAELREGARVEGLLNDGTCVRARVGGEAVRADFVVGADGANGIVARSFDLGDGIVRGVALEGNVPLAALDRDLDRTAVIELAVVPGGYGWVFPKGDHANLGVGGWGSEGPLLRDHLS